MTKSVVRDLHLEGIFSFFHSGAVEEFWVGCKYFNTPFLMFWEGHEHKIQYTSIDIIRELFTFAARLNIVYPMLFKLTNTNAKRYTHCGVLEFVADEGKVFIPHWVS